MRSIALGEIVKIWPAKYEEFAYGVLVKIDIRLESEDSYSVYANGEYFQLPRKQIFVDEEKPGRTLDTFFPNVTRVFPPLIVNELVSVQPMTGPTGQLFYLDYQFKKDKSEDTDDVLKD